MNSPLAIAYQRIKLALIGKLKLNPQLATRTLAQMFKLMTDRHRRLVHVCVSLIPVARFVWHYRSYIDISFLSNSCVVPPTNDCTLSSLQLPTVSTNLIQYISHVH